MTDLGPYLERLCLEQYLDAFIGEGFETWETLLDIQERDFDALNVKLGHRRKLQRAIAEYRGVSYERLVGSPAQDGPLDHSRSIDGAQQTSITTIASGVVTETKRKYRRHPKPDDNAPLRPPSAYVIFSNKIREEVKPENLTFTQIAKLVGDRWQKLDPNGKQPYESQATAAKERYNIEYSAYKKTEKHKDYMLYLADFKAKHGGAPEQKKARLDPESSAGSVSGKSLELLSDWPSTGPGHARGGSVGSVDSSTYSQPVASPAAILTPSVSTPISLTPATQQTRLPMWTASRNGSPPSVTGALDTHRRTSTSTHASTPDEPASGRNEQTAPLPRAISNPSTVSVGAIPPSSLNQSSMQLGLESPSANQSRRNDLSSYLDQRGGLALAEEGSSQTHIHVPFMQMQPSPTTLNRPWRNRGLDSRGHQQPARSLPPPKLQAYRSGPSPTPNALSTLISPDRYNNVTQVQSQRFLPLPRASSTSSPCRPPHHLLPITGHRDLSRASSHDFEARKRERLDKTPSTTLARSDSHHAAANALAGLAAGGLAQAAAHVVDQHHSH